MFLTNDEKSLGLERGWKNYLDEWKMFEGYQKHCTLFQLKVCNTYIYISSFNIKFLCLSAKKSKC